MKIIKIEHGNGEVYLNVSEIKYMGYRQVSHDWKDKYYMLTLKMEYFFKDKEQYEKALKIWKENASE